VKGEEGGMRDVRVECAGWWELMGGREGGRER